MHKLLLLALVACGSAPTSKTTQQTAPRKTTATAPSVHDTTVEAVVGVWLGNAEGTPFGNFPMALDFRPQADGSIHARLDDGKGMYLDFRFARKSGTWQLLEEGAIPDVGKQNHTLLPIANKPHWADDSVDVGFTVSATQLVMTTAIDGKPHATFRLERKSGPEAEQIRQKLASSVSPAE